MNQSIALIGLPHAGKTTWLGRLWVGINQEKTRLKLPCAPDDFESLDHLSEWLEEGEYPDRTSVTSPPDMRLRLAWEGDNHREPFDLHIADYNGEEVKSIYDNREQHWTAAWDARAAVGGLAVIVRHDQIKNLQSSRFAPSPRVPTPDDAAQHFPQQFLPDHHIRPEGERLGPPSGVAIVELLQLLRHARGLPSGQHPPPGSLRLAVILSCWDTIPTTGGPAAYLREHLGLLDDFLATNFDPASVRIFGLSTTGGNLKDETFREEYLRGDPEDFGGVWWDAVEGLQQSPDITLPLGWLLEGDDALDAEEHDEDRA